MTNDNLRYSNIIRRVDAQLEFLAGLTQSEIEREIADYCSKNRYVFIWAFDEDATGFYTNEDVDDDFDEFVDEPNGGVITKTTHSLIALVTWFSDTLRVFPRCRCVRGYWVK